MLSALSYCLESLVCIVDWLEVIKQRNLECRPVVYISLDTVPGIYQPIKQGHCNLNLLDVICELNQFKVHTKLMAEPTH